MRKKVFFIVILFLIAIILIVFSALFRKRGKPIRNIPSKSNKADGSTEEKKEIPLAELFSSENMRKHRKSIQHKNKPGTAQEK